MTYVICCIDTTI